MIEKINFHTGQMYHVYNRSNGRDLMFRHPGNYSHFLRKYYEYMSGLWDTHAYCLMPTHFHCVITVRPNSNDHTDMSLKCSRAFSNFANSYTQSFNRLHSRHGSLFAQNFRRKVISDAEYLKTLICYIHNNPVKDGIAQHPSDWQFSSYNDLIKRNETLLGQHPIISLFGSKQEFMMKHGLYVASDQFNIVLRKVG